MLMTIYTNAEVTLTRNLILALDLGGTQLRLALADRYGKLLRRCAALAHPEEEVIPRIKQAVWELTSDIGHEQLLGMGLAVAGLVRPETGVLVSSPNLPKLKDVPVKTLLEQEMKVPVWVANDASLAALGEHRFGAGRGFSHLVYITVSTGIGGGVISDDRLLLGSEGFAAEIGHMVIDPDGPRCACGNAGCLEALASGTAVARMARERISKMEPGAISGLANNDPKSVDAKVVAEAARSGDPLAQEVMETAGRFLGIGVVNVVHLFDPELVIIGGGVSNAGELLLAPVRKVIAERAMSGFNKVKVVTSALGDDSGLLGAVAWVLDNYNREKRNDIITEAGSL